MGNASSKKWLILLMISLPAVIYADYAFDGCVSGIFTVSAKQFCGDEGKKMATKYIVGIVVIDLLLYFGLKFRKKL